MKLGLACAVVSAVTLQASGFVVPSGLVGLRPSAPKVDQRSASARRIGQLSMVSSFPEAGPEDWRSDAAKWGVGMAKGAMDQVFAGEGRDYARFYALEVIARVPYFSYLTVLHLYQSLGQRGKAKVLKTHFAETFNEEIHCEVMEELGGSMLFKDRFFAQHLAVGYFFLAILLYLLNPTVAYHLNQHVEEHAFLTYDAFLKENGEELKKQPPLALAKEYYEKDELYCMNSLLCGSGEERRRPQIESLYDVFDAIRADEMEHVKTMVHLQKLSSADGWK